MLRLAAGTLVRQGDSNPIRMIAGSLAGSLLGESIYYAAGCYVGPWVQGHTGRTLAGAWQEAQKRFGAQAALAVYLSRFLLTPISIPTNVIACCRQYACWRFALSAHVGDLMWVAGHGLSGYAKKSNCNASD
jgi:membrane protein DedA with SNARE-associated domain